MNPFGYPEPVWRLFRETPHTGSWPVDTPDVLTGQAGSPASRAVLQLHLRRDGERIAEARFQAYGCPTTIAVGAWLAGWAQGRDLADLDTLNAGALREALEIPEERAHCAFLGEDAVKALLSKVKSNAHPVD